MAPDSPSSRSGWRLFALVLLVTALVYWPGLYGGWLFDDYPNIVDNKGVQPEDARFPSLVNAALSSPSSEFRRPIASLTFAANFLASGLDPFWMKLTNLAIHLLNGVLVFIFVRMLISCIPAVTARVNFSRCAEDPWPLQANPGGLALLVTTAWMLLPINLTAVLYVVQRMESLANLFVLVGLIGYLCGRQRMWREMKAHWFSPGFFLCIASVTLPTMVGAMAKETAVMLPLYALMVEWCLFDFNTSTPNDTPMRARDNRIVAMFLLILLAPLLAGLGYLLPGLLQPKAWATRDFTMGTRLLSEARIVLSYVSWTVAPTPHALSFYHDDFQPSTGWMRPWTTAGSMFGIALLAATVIWLRKRRPLAALGIACFLASNLLTGTILPLELVYEHRNYFASLGIMLALVPPLAPPSISGEQAIASLHPHLRVLILGGLLFLWIGQTTWTAVSWGNPLQLSRMLAERAPASPRAQYELGRTYIIYSGYDPNSTYVPLAYEALEKAAQLPGSSILPEQALIFMNSRMRLPLKDAWWNSLIGKLAARRPGVQDESSLGALTQCARDNSCSLPLNRMNDAYSAAIAHSDPSARLLSMYADFAWNLLGDHSLGLNMARKAVQTKPTEPAYQITLIRMLVASGETDEAKRQLEALKNLDIGGRLDDSLHSLDGLLKEQSGDTHARAAQNRDGT